MLNCENNCYKLQFFYNYCILLLIIHWQSYFTCKDRDKLADNLHFEQYVMKIIMTVCHEVYVIKY